MFKECYEYVADESKFNNINSIYFNLESALLNKGVDNYELIKRELVECIKYMVESKIAIVKFRDWVKEREFLESTTLENKLEYFYDSLPTEIDDSIPEKDVNNLWWYVECPIDIGWKMEDGTYWFS